MVPLNLWKLTVNLPQSQKVSGQLGKKYKDSVTVRFCDSRILKIIEAPEKQFIVRWKDSQQKKLGLLRLMVCKMEMCK